MKIEVLAGVRNIDGWVFVPCPRCSNQTYVKIDDQGEVLQIEVHTCEGAYSRSYKLNRLAEEIPVRLAPPKQVKAKRPKKTLQKKKLDLVQEIIHDLKAERVFKKEVKLNQKQEDRSIMSIEPAPRNYVQTFGSDYRPRGLIINSKHSSGFYKTQAEYNGSWSELDFGIYFHHKGSK